MDSKSVARQKIQNYLNNIADTPGVENKILMMDELFEYLSTTGRIMFEETMFRESVRSKLFELFFEDCVPKAVVWYRMIFKCEISQDKPSHDNRYIPWETCK